RTRSLQSSANGSRAGQCGLRSWRSLYANTLLVRPHLCSESPVWCSKRSSVAPAGAPTLRAQIPPQAGAPTPPPSKGARSKEKTDAEQLFHAVVLAVVSGGSSSLVCKPWHKGSRGNGNSRQHACE